MLTSEDHIYPSVIQAWRAAIHGVAKSETRLSNWTELNNNISSEAFSNFCLSVMFSNLYQVITKYNCLKNWFCICCIKHFVNTLCFLQLDIPVETSIETREGIIKAKRKKGREGGRKKGRNISRKGLCLLRKLLLFSCSVMSDSFQPHRL